MVFLHGTRPLMWLYTLLRGVFEFLKIAVSSSKPSLQAANLGLALCQKQEKGMQWLHALEMTKITNRKRAEYNRLQIHSKNVIALWQDYD